MAWHVLYSKCVFRRFFHIFTFFSFATKRSIIIANRKKVPRLFELFLPPHTYYRFIIDENGSFPLTERRYLMIQSGFTIRHCPTICHTEKTSGCCFLKAKTPVSRIGRRCLVRSVCVFPKSFREKVLWEDFRPL